MTGWHIILSAVNAEIAARRKYWIGGVPTPADMEAVEKHIARRLKVSLDVLRAALPWLKTDNPQPPKDI